MNMHYPKPEAAFDSFPCIALLEQFFHPVMVMVQKMLMSSV
jgi:hypothetical protein